MTKKRYASYLLALAAMAPGAFALPGTEGARPLPNVILIITDDQGYGDLSCLGNPILRTPALDRLHAESVRFTDFHVGPTCAPTRASLMTGHWANRTGVWHTILGRSLLRPDTPTVAELFTTAGYATGLFGKWHLGDNFPFRPEDRGFQEVVRHGAGGVGQTPDGWDNAYFDDRYYHNGVLRLFEGYCTDVFFGEAQRFMAASAAAGQPFFAYISTNAPHAPFHCPEEFVAPYRGRGLTPEEEVFLGMIANIDANVATLRAWLEEAGLADNTILIFMTDNGTATGERIYNAGMRGKKGSPYDGGHRVPFFLHWPDGGLHEGRDVDSLAGGVDFLPTLVELCGLTTPSGYRADGRSLVPLLFNLPLPWPDRVLITDSQRVVDPIKWRQSSVMTGDWRLVNGTELYAIKADPGQVKDLATTRPEVVARLRAAYEAWWAELEPTFADTVRIVVGHPEAPVVDLTAHDWLTDGTYPPWNQMMVRRGDQVNGHWALAVHQPGRYRIELRRWPAEAAAPIRATLPAGAGVPGLDAYRETPGRGLAIVEARLATAGGQWIRPVAETDTVVHFEVEWRAGDVELETQLVDDAGGARGAYFARVTYLEPVVSAQP
jgi:arylsulfatase A-like enzyme